MQKTTTILGTLMIGLALSLGAGCSRDEAKEAAAEAKETAAEVRDDAAEAAAAVKEKTEDAAAKMGVSDPVARCRELAAQGAWSDALEPCAKAHEMNPDDMALEHALQQAKAAAGQ
jgi:hypothetical protein